jgi:uncharacterized membrane protein YvbJ
MEEEEFSEASENFCQIKQQHIPENGTILYVIIIIIIIIIIFFFFFYLSRVRPFACSNFTKPVSFLDAPHLF